MGIADDLNAIPMPDLQPEMQNEPVPHMEPARFFVTFLIFPPEKSFPQRQRALLFTLQLLPELLGLGLQLLLFIFECFCCL